MKSTPGSYDGTTVVYEFEANRAITTSKFILFTANSKHRALQSYILTQLQELEQSQPRPVPLQAHKDECRSAFKIFSKIDNLIQCTYLTV
jgi:hypothetical protein